jgi:hypothetical protein
MGREREPEMMMEDRNEHRTSQRYQHIARLAEERDNAEEELIRVEAELRSVIYNIDDE